MAIVNVVRIGLMVYAYTFRLTPLYVVAILVSVAFETYIGSGPLMNWAGPTIGICKKNWWLNLLYVNNLVVEADKQVCNMFLFKRLLGHLNVLFTGPSEPSRQKVGATKMWSSHSKWHPT